MAAHEATSQTQFVTQQSEISKHIYRNNARRSGGGATAAQVRACRAKTRFREEYGASDPKIQRLYRLCRGVGL